jgi:hypothetical protein
VDVHRQRATLPLPLIARAWRGPDQ